MIFTGVLIVKSDKKSRKIYAVEMSSAFVNKKKPSLLSLQRPLTYIRCIATHSVTMVLINGMATMTCRGINHCH